MNKLICKDYTVSGKEFELVYNSDLEMYITHPKPSEKELPIYYKSEAYISHTDSKKSLFDKVYQLVKNYTISKKVKLIDSFQTKEKTLLDIGCGTGDFLSASQKKEWEVSGIEPNIDAQKLALTKLKKNSIIYFDIDELLEKDTTKKFDVISLWHVLEHVPDYDDYIKKIKELLKKEGVLIIAVPNHKSYDAQFYKNFWAAFDVPRHLWHFSQKSIRLIFGKHKMEVVKTLPMKFDSYYVSLLSEKNKKGKTNPFVAFMVGFKSNLRAYRTKEYSSLIYIFKNIK